MNMGSKVSSDGTSAPAAVCGGRGARGGRGVEVKEGLVTMVVTDIMLMMVWQCS